MEYIVLLSIGGIVYIIVVLNALIKIIERIETKLETEDRVSDDGWISVKKRMPTEDALYLVHAISLDLMKPFINTAWFDPGNDMGFENIPKVWSDAITHWMPLPKAPLAMFEKPGRDDIHAIG